ncbi:YbhB/YbcL family Raf kinase inhibitor-like protein [Hydrogenimonas urashimensis]|uniref:YbhB/YbcL family Raf kinase inhibitor-like protein n=1 Tax=Hydrogenimonas urashimensis TaxID=2740515 RepID=UPI001F2240FD|nr:YbhB/YbcL family Raf kinase inhibitor-like protein [Hydrogenimonas urashimensis]
MGKLFRLMTAVLALQIVLAAGGFTLESPDLSQRLSPAQVYNGYGCRGKNISPELRWHGEPKGTKSFAVTMFDPDAPRKGGWWHWLVFNIPSGCHRLPRGAGDPQKGMLPDGAVQSMNDFGEKGYGGACPPRGHGLHRYIVTVYALDVAKLALDAGTPPAEVAAMIEKHTLAKASITSRYGR